jgi:hypothetical protein
MWVWEGKRHMRKSKGKEDYTPSLHALQVQIVVDGYSAPLSAGNFVANVIDGLYNGRCG